MVDPNISEQEKTCIQVLATFHGQGHIDRSELIEALEKKGLKLDGPQFESLMGMMAQYKAIEAPRHLLAEGGRYSSFAASPISVQLVRELDAQEKQLQSPRDIVGQIQEKARRHPFFAWLIIAIIVLTTIITFVNQLIQLLKNIGVLPNN